MRVQKYIADCGVMSRRAAEEAVAQGRVLINGIPAKTGQPVLPGKDTVAVDGREARPASGKTYIMFNKPRGYVTTMADEQGRKCMADLLAQAIPDKRLYPVGRLDLDSEGLLVCTDDGELANRLMHPSHEVEKRYRVLIEGFASDEALTKLAQPVQLDGRDTVPAKVRLLTRNERSTLLEMTIFEGRNRQIRRICTSAELRVLRLRRTGEGRLRLGALHTGEWRYLSDGEIEYLKNIQ